jgi:hypothetical protein
MNLRSLTNRVKGTIERRGGTGALKEDAEELRDIAKRRGSVADKVKEGVEAVREPGTTKREPRGGAASERTPR